jgi:hypothetical protein
MSSTFTLSDDTEIYIITLHRMFKIKVIQLINDLNNRLDKCIQTRVKDIAIIVNSTFKTNYTEATINEIITRLNNGEMNDLFHTYDVDRLLSNYVENKIIDTKATLVCLKPYTEKCFKCEQKLGNQFNQYVDVYDLNKVTKGGVYISFCTHCQYRYWPNHYEIMASGEKFVTPESIYNQKFIYFGGKKGYSLELLIHFTSLFLRQYTGFENFQHSFNLSVKKYSGLGTNEQSVSIK